MKNSIVSSLVVPLVAETLMNKFESKSQKVFLGYSLTGLSLKGAVAGTRDIKVSF